MGRCVEKKVLSGCDVTTVLMALLQLWLSSQDLHETGYVLTFYHREVDLLDIERGVLSLCLLRDVDVMGRSKLRGLFVSKLYMYTYT